MKLSQAHQKKTSDPGVIVAYIPVLHRGYLNFLQKYSKANALYLIGQEFLEQLPQLHKDIRALSPSQMQKALEALDFAMPIKILTAESLAELKAHPQLLIMPDEEVTRWLAETSFAGWQITFDSVFLRWDTQKSLEPKVVQPDQEMSLSEAAQNLMDKAQDLKELSSDWWRQVGGVVVKDGQILFSAHNIHVPSPQEPYYSGDPRGNFHKGQHIELSTALHAEAGLIAKAAEAGVSLKGAQLFVTTFPCPNCAKLVAYSGIAEVYFQDGYAMVDGESIMKEKGVKIIKVTNLNFTKK